MTSENIWGSETDPEHPSAEEPQVRVITKLHRVSVLFDGGCITKALDDTISMSIDTSCQSQSLLFALRIIVVNQ